MLLLRHLSLFILIIVSFSAKAQEVGQALPEWQPGMLDLHHINTGRGDAAYYIFPDGTTMLVDAGDMSPLGPRIGTPRNTKIHPDSTQTPPQWIVQYIEQFTPSGNQPVLDYAMITHFHDDHYGAVHQYSATSQEGNYKLTGITEVGELILIKMMLDRGYPDYAYPVPLKGKDLRQIMAFNPPFKEWYKTFDNYQKFIEYQREHQGMQAASLKVGSKNQIVLKHQPEQYPDFEVRNIKSNGTFWTGKGDSAYEYFPDFSQTPVQERPSENPLSNAILIRYGPFDYYTGGDMPGIADLGTPEWMDVETPTAKAVGPVDIATLNHHGNRDCCNETFVSTLQPRVWIEQTWSSDHPGHEVLRRITSDYLYPGERDLFATNIMEANKQVIGPSLENAYRSTEGHILVRVLQGGKEYYVITLNDENTNYEVTGVYGPYATKEGVTTSTK
uniref:Metallo-beta-lactamase domain-containing protein n=1 Tax=Roseihalotalea indica TaxID=2867963 RepID=A0AA49GRZ0_9BACT|nr:hypothetical protein K4G66_08920 [Tunicatimonas sp. TK19036]